MANIEGFDADAHEPTKAFELLDTGWYTAIITESEIKPTKAGTGKYLALTFEIVSEPGKGRKLWANLNVKNPNSTAVEIALGDLSAICRAIGVTKPKDSVELHNKPLSIKVISKYSDYKSETVNELGGYLSCATTPTAPEKAERSFASWVK